MGPTVFLVDADPRSRHLSASLLGTLGVTVLDLADAQALLDGCSADQAGCIVTELRLPDLDGLALQAELKRRDCLQPLIVLSRHATVASAIQALKAGAFDVLEQPVERERLATQVQAALEEDERRRQRSACQRAVRQRWMQLTPREHEVLRLTLQGLVNKLIAAELGISHRTVEIHRARAMQKMGAANSLMLARMVLIDPDLLGELGSLEAQPALTT
ncbi:MAG: response regulator transcription factor [Leptothrix sp. (in: b-proteobacteria)]